MDEARRLAGASAPRSGGSPIPMQLVKNLLLHQGQTYDRKLREVILAVAVEALFSKDARAAPAMTARRSSS